MPTQRTAILLSIRPAYASTIMDGSKTVELRRRFPQHLAMGTVALFYASSPVQAIVGHARIREVKRLPIDRIWQEFSEAARIKRSDFDEYFTGCDRGSAIFLYQVVQLRDQLKMMDLRKRFGLAPPQSFRYIDGACDSLIRHERV